MSLNDALWVKGVGTRPVAHLLRPNGGATRDRRSWCDASTDNHSPAPYLTRCGSCIAAVRRYNEEAVQPVPKRVVTVLLVRIEHGSEETHEEVLQTAVRRIAPGRNPRWHVKADINAYAPLSSDEAVN